MLTHLVVVAFIAFSTAGGQYVRVTDTNETPLAEVRFSHNHDGGPAWYVSHNRTDATGAAYVKPMHRFWAYQSVRVEKTGYQSQNLSRDQFTADYPTVIVLEAAP